MKRLALFLALLPSLALAQPVPPASLNSSSGVTVSTTQTISGAKTFSSGVTLSGSAPQLTASLATATLKLNSATNDATTSSSVAGFNFHLTGDITAGDLLAMFTDSSDNIAFKITEAGTATALLALAAPTVTATTTYVLPDGSLGAGTLALGFSSDTDTGFYRSGSGVVQAVSDGTISYSFDVNGPRLNSNPGGFTGTNASGTGISSADSGRFRTFRAKVTIGETALTDGDTQQDLTVFTLPAGAVVHRMVVVTATGFTGSTLAAFTIQCGPSVGSAAYLASGSIFAAGTLGDVAAEIGTGLLSATLADLPSMSSTTAISCRFDSSGANVVAATAGSLVVYIIYSQFT